MMRSIIAQLARARDEIPSGVKHLFDNQQNLSTDTLLSVLIDLSNTSNLTYIVLDALDESDTSERDDLFKVLNKISRSQKINLLMTSRKEPDIQGALERFSLQAISIQNAAVDDDIRHHVIECLQNNQKLQKWSRLPSMKSEIETALVNGSQGM